MNPNWPAGMMEEIESILSKHREWPDGLDSYDALFESATFFPLQRRRELEKMMQICRKVGQIPCPTCFDSKRHLSALDEMNCGTCKGTGMFGGPKTVMIIGADKGADVFHFVKCLPTVRRVIACEIRGTPYGEVFKQNFTQADFFFLPMGSQSSIALAGVKWVLGYGRIDILFIDGDKNAFKEDFDAYRPFMAPGGIALMHDVYLDPVNGGCQAAFEEVGKSYRTEKIIDLSEHEADKEKQQRGEPAEGSYGAWLRYYNDIPTCGVGVIYI